MTIASLWDKTEVQRRLSDPLIYLNMDIMKTTNRLVAISPWLVAMGMHYPCPVLRRNPPDAFCCGKQEQELPTPNKVCIAATNGCLWNQNILLSRSTNQAQYGTQYTI